MGNASRVEQTEKARVCTAGRHLEDQKDWEPAGKQIHDIRPQQDMAALPVGAASNLACPGRNLNLSEAGPVACSAGQRVGRGRVVYRQNM